jgi:hypothetical protein
MVCYDSRYPPAESGVYLIAIIGHIKVCGRLVSLPKQANTNVSQGDNLCLWQQFGVDWEVGHRK